MRWYEFIVSSRPKNQYVSFGWLEKLILSNGEIVNKPKVNDIIELTYKNDLDSISSIDITLDHQKDRQDEQPPPDFLSIDINFVGVNSRARKFLDNLNIEYYSIPIKFTNSENSDYKMIFFNHIDILDLTRMNAFVKNNQVRLSGSGTPVNEVYVEPLVNKYQGIHAVKYLGTSVICDEATKEALEKSKLTGFRFSEVNISNSK